MPSVFSKGDEDLGDHPGLVKVQHRRHFTHWEFRYYKTLFKNPFTSDNNTSATTGHQNTTSLTLPFGQKIIPLVPFPLSQGKCLHSGGVCSNLAAWGGGVPWWFTYMCLHPSAQIV